MHIFSSCFSNFKRSDSSVSSDSESPAAKVVELSAVSNSPSRFTARGDTANRARVPADHGSTSASNVSLGNKQIDLPTIRLGGLPLIGPRARQSGLRARIGGLREQGNFVNWQATQMRELHTRATQNPAVNTNGEFVVPPASAPGHITQRAWLARTQRLIAESATTLDVTVDQEQSTAAGTTTYRGKETTIPRASLNRLVQAHEARVVDQAKQVGRAQNNRQSVCCVILEFMGFEPQQALNVAQVLCAPDDARSAPPRWVADLNAEIDRRLGAYQHISQSKYLVTADAEDSEDDQPAAHGMAFARITIPEQPINPSDWAQVKPVTSAYVTMTLANLSTHRFLQPRL
jgi:hypothetical protein